MSTLYLVYCTYKDYEKELVGICSTEKSAEACRDEDMGRFLQQDVIDGLVEYEIKEIYTDLRLMFMDKGE